MRTRRHVERRPKARPVIRDFFEDAISVDAFAGCGGASHGTASALGKPVDIAINHDPVAIAVHEDNSPFTEHYRADIFSVDPVRACRGRHVRHLHASPDCRHHSRASGSAPRSESVRALADVVPKWARAVRPDVITLENVREFEEWGPLDDEGRPDKARKGETFAAWKAELEELGYVVEHRVLSAHHFGAPTSRRRFYLVARCDGQPVRWPEPTHGPGLKPYRTAAECIDWSLPCPSIFGRKRPLADATLRRVAAGVVKFVLQNPRPFIVKVNHQGERAPESIDRPLTTVTAARRGHALVSPTLVQTGYGERENQAPRVLDLHRPLGTVVAGGQKHGLVEALLAPFISQFNLGQVGHEVTKPLPTITAIDHHALVNVRLASPEFAAQYPNARHVLPFLITYYGSLADIGQDVQEPLRTITTHDRFALVTVVVDGTEYAIVDIGLRMLEPAELLRAQFGEFAEGFRLDKAKTKKDQVRLIGNSVVPAVMRAIVAANIPADGATPPRARRAA